MALALCALGSPVAADDVLPSSSQARLLYAPAPNAEAQVRLGRLRVRPTVSSGVISNIEYLGSKRVAFAATTIGTAGVDATASIRYVGSARHILIAQDGNNANFAPVEYTDTAVFDSDGTCTGGTCPNTTWASTPQLPIYGNWAYTNAAGLYDFFHGVIGVCYGTVSCGDGGTTPISAAAYYGGAGIRPADMEVVEGTPDRLWFTWGSSYGGYYEFNFGFCDLTTDDVAGSVDGVSNCYGPFNSETYLSQLPADCDPLGTCLSANRYKGLRSASFFSRRHTDGAMLWGGAGSGTSFQQGFGSAGPTLFKADSLPTTASTAGPSGANFTASVKYLAYYNMACGTHTPTNCYSAAMNLDGSVPGGQAIWAFRHYGHIYGWDGQSCALNAGAAGCPTYTRVNSQGAPMAIDPIKNSGTGTWGESDSLTGCIWFDGTNKDGVVCAGSFATNHRFPITDYDVAWTDIGVGNPAVNWYCSGAMVGDAGVNCAGVGSDSKSPDRERVRLDVGASPAPTVTHKEPVFVIFNLTHMAEVAAGTRTDYTVDPADTIYPMVEFAGNDALKFNLGTAGSHKGISAVAQDPEQPNLFIVIAPDADSTSDVGQFLPVVHYFWIHDD
jgi:hypothetical protein